MVNNKKKSSGILSVISSLCVILIMIPFAFSTKAASNDNGQSDYIKYQTNLSTYTYNIQVKHSDKWLQTTYLNKGYKVKIKIDDNIRLYELKRMPNGIPTQIVPGIYVTLNISLVNEGRYAKIEYVVKNDTNSSHKISIGTGADIEIGINYNTAITKFENCSGFKMVAAGTDKPEVNFIGKNACGITNVDTFWYGQWYAINENLFTQVNYNSSSGDSGMAYSWKDRNISANSAQSYSVLMGIGSINKAPTMEISNPAETFGIVSLGGNYSFSGTVLDADNTPGTKVYYYIDETTSVLAYTFNQTPGDFTADVDIPNNLSIGTHSISFYAQDSSGAVSAVQTRTFTIPQPTYSVSFNSNGGSEVESITNVTSGDKITTPTEPTKSGYALAGWYKDSELTSAWDFGKDEVTANIMLYAKWDKITVSIIETPTQIKNSDMISIVADDDAFRKSIDVRIKYDTSVEEALKTILKEKYEDTIIFPLDISIFDKDTGTKVQPNSGKSVKITLPIPQDLLSKKDKIMVACLVDGEMKVLESEVVLINEVYCIQFSATHFSPYAMLAEKEESITIIEEQSVPKTKKPLQNIIDASVPKAETVPVNTATASVPNTSDNTSLLSSSLVAITSMAIIIGISKKRKQDESM